jgi:hypothetical protein
MKSEEMGLGRERLASGPALENSIEIWELVDVWFPAGSSCREWGDEMEVRRL